MNLPEAFGILDHKVNGTAAQRADFIGKCAGPQYSLNRSIGIFLLGSDQIMDEPGCAWHPLQGPELSIDSGEDDVRQLRIFHQQGE